MMEMIWSTLTSLSARTWDVVGIKAARPALGGVSRTLAAHRKQKDALAGPDLDPRRVALRPV